MFTLCHRSAWPQVSQAGSSLGGFGYSGAEAEQGERRRSADQGRSQPANAEVLRNICSLGISVWWERRWRLLCLFVTRGLWSSFREGQQGLAHVVEKELQRVSQRLQQLSRHHHPHTPSPRGNIRTHTGKTHTVTEWDWMILSDQHVTKIWLKCCTLRISVKL